MRHFGSRGLFFGGAFALLCCGQARAALLRNAAALSLVRQDFVLLSHGIRESFLSRPIRGTIAPGSLGGTSGPYSVDKIDYTFRVPRLEVVPSYHGVRVHATIAELSLRIRRVFLDSGKNIHCGGVRISSRASEIPVFAEVTPSIENGRLRFRIPGLDVGLTARNFHVDSVDYCEGLGAFNGLAARLIPAIANKMQGKIRAQIHGSAESAAATLTQAVGKLIDAGFPITIPGATKLSAVLVATGFRFSDGAMRVLVGAKLGGTPNPANAFTLSEIEAFASGTGDSFLAVTPAFVDGLLKSLFRRTARGEYSVPFAGELTASFLTELIPDSTKRFSPDDPLTAAIVTPQEIAFEVNGAPTPQSLDFRLRVVDLPIDFVVKKAPYYRLRLGGTVPALVRYYPEKEKIDLAIKSVMGITFGGGAFAAGLSPEPVAGSGVTAATFTKFQTDVESLFGGEPLAILEFETPELRLGRTHVGFLGFRTAPKIVAVPFRLRRS